MWILLVPRMLLWILPSNTTLASLNKQETKIDGRTHEIFFEKFTGPWNI